MLDGSPMTTISNGTETARRMRLLGCTIERGKASTARVTVEFDGPAPGQRLVCHQDGFLATGGDLRLAAMATLNALTQATGGELGFVLIGVRPVRAFDTTVIMVAISVQRGGGVTRLVGAAIAEEDQLLATVRAVLHATNRFATPLLKE
jgi:hypothetical protein